MTLRKHLRVLAMNEKETLLVVDDREEWLATIKIILRSRYDLVLCSNIATAQEAFANNDFDLIILDKNVPDENSGLLLLKEFRTLKPSIPAIVLTDYEDVRSAVESMKIGAADYIPKNTKDLKSVLISRINKSLSSEMSKELITLISKGESDTLEFKSSLYWDTREEKQNKELGKIVTRTIASFMNAESGGTLLIGVDDSGKILGLRHDYKTLGKKQDRDAFENVLISLVLDSCGKKNSPLFKTRFYEIGGNDICRIDIKPSSRPVFVKGTEHLFVRMGNSTRSLNTEDAIEYCKIRWPN